MCILVFLCAAHINTYVNTSTDCSLHLPAENDELSNHHYQRLYETQGCYTVVPASFILGKLPLMPDFGTLSIPHHHATRRQRDFPHGWADSSSTAQDGSKLYYINHFAAAAD
jgi:hypothetical protein